MTDRHIQINRVDEWPGLSGVEDRLRAAAEAALDAPSPGTAAPGSVDLSVTLLPAGEMRELNRTYHGVDAPTDVLAFDLGEAGRTAAGEPGSADPRAGTADSAPRRSMLADLYVCPDEARRSAREEGVPEREELARLVIHGVLHLLGHEHPEGPDRYASEMFRLQERLLASIPGDRPPSGRERPG